AVDLNRARDEGGPNGVIKSTDFKLRGLYAANYAIDAEERERRLLAYYDPFHAEIEKRLAIVKFRFLLDGHSMTAQGPALGPDKGSDRPALCIGTFGDSNGDPVGNAPVSLEPDLARAVRDAAIPLLRKAFPGWDREWALLNTPFD